MSIIAYSPTTQLFYVLTQDAVADTELDLFYHATFYTNLDSVPQMVGFDGVDRWIMGVGASNINNVGYTTSHGLLSYYAVTDATCYQSTFTFGLD